MAMIAATWIYAYIQWVHASIREALNGNCFDFELESFCQRGTKNRTFF